MKKFGRFFFNVFFCLSLFLAGSASADTVITGLGGSNPTQSLNNGASVDGTNNAGQGTFSMDILSMGDGTEDADVAFSDIPYLNIGSSLYFQFIYDQQETGPLDGSNPEIHIDDIVISVAGPVIVWDYDQGTYGSLILNKLGETYTATPLGNGGDVALYVPVSLFSGLGLTGNDMLNFKVTQSMSNNGPDEWVLLAGGTFFEPGDPICVPGDPDCPTELPPPITINPVPEPATMLLLGTGLAGLAGAARRRKKNQI